MSKPTNHESEGLSSSKKRKIKDTTDLETKEQIERDSICVSNKEPALSTRGVRTRSRSKVVVTDTAELYTWWWEEGANLAIVNENGTVLHQSTVGNVDSHKPDTRGLSNVPIRLCDKKKTNAELVIDANRECGQYVLKIGTRRYGAFNRKNVYLVAGTIVLTQRSEYGDREKRNKQSLTEFMELLKP